MKKKALLSNAKNKIIISRLRNNKYVINRFLILAYEMKIRINNQKKIRIDIVKGNFGMFQATRHTLTNKMYCT